MSSLAASACGARSQLIAPDGGVDAEAHDATDHVDIVDRQPTLDASFQPAIDLTCPGTCPFGGATPTFPPFVPLVPPDLPASCTNGFELAGVRAGCGAVYRLISPRPEGAHAITLAVDLATYRVPDAVTITGLAADGSRYVLLETCRLQTGTVGGPSNRRPPDDTIRQFRIDVQEGTRELDVDVGAVTSPMYLRVLGLCDFTVSTYPEATWWRAVP